jgi:hypothetical protein
MEALWVEISREKPAPKYPDWHAEILEENQSRVSAGTENLMDWEEAKRRRILPGLPFPDIDSLLLYAGIH